MSSGYFKIFKSYFQDILIESTSSVHNPNLQLYLVDGRYQLCANDAIYSFDDKYANFAEAFKRTNWNNNQVKHVLLLGLGLASIPYILEKSHQQVFEYTAIEIDEAVIYLASKYRLPKLKANIHIIHTDAALFIEQNLDTYDMICMDVFIDQEIPKAFITENYFHKLYELLNPKGLLFFNILVKGHEESADYICEKLSTIFEQSEIIPVENNIIVKAIK